MTLLPIVADARKAGWEHLRDKRNTLGCVLLNAEEEYGKDNKAAARTDPEKSRGETPDEADDTAIKQTIRVPTASSELTSTNLRRPRAGRSVGALPGAWHSVDVL